MSLNRYAAKRDANEAEIITALRDEGYIVVPLAKPLDLLVSRPSPNPEKSNPWILLEVKAEDGQLTEGQLRFWKETEGCIRAVVKTTQQALRVCHVFIDLCQTVGVSNDRLD